jgi:hypothetical protein
VKRLGQPHRLTCNTLDGKMVVLGLLGGLQHGLERLPLMGGVQRLDDTVLGKISSVTRLKARIEAILKSGA